MVGAAGFEPAASWSRTRTSHKMNKLEAFAAFSHCCQSLLLFNHLEHALICSLSTMENASMQGVGTKSGTAKACLGASRIT